jgi:hypothetical protein
MQAEERHWTTNDELIERFILNQLEPEERNELEDHLRICEVCKRAVRAEQMVVAGIRRAGREQFKAELRKKASFPERQTPWVQILSAAAAIVILLTVGIYNRWFENQLPQPSLTPIVPSEHSQAEHDKEVASPAIAEQSTHSGREASASARPDGGFNGATINPQRDAMIRPQEQRTDGKTLSDDENKTESIWIEGTILPPAADEWKEKANVNDNRPAGEAYGLRKTDREPVRPATQAAAKQNINVGLISLSQQTSVTLPRAQQRLQVMNSAAKVMSKAERIGDKILLTLYLDSLVDENDLANTQVETPRNDSLILNLPNQRIGYRFPAGWNTQMNSKPDK